MRLLRNVPVVLVLVLVAVWLGATVASARPQGHAARTCGTPPYPGRGYFTSLSVTATSCRTGSRVAVAYYHCRTRHGKAGRCRGGVLGFGCSEVRHSIPTEIYGRVTCTLARARVVHSYQQDL